jgi:hypothetical protein
MITPEFAQQFAEEWIAAWNSHDLSQILAHYTDDFEMSSPFIIKTVNLPSGTLKGKAAVGAYWQRALENMPDLHFGLIEVLSGVDSIGIYYHSVQNLRALEWLSINTEGKIQKAIAHYSYTL